MIGPMHPEVTRMMQASRWEDLDRALRGCRRIDPRARRRRGAAPPEEEG
jgi:hypothetical protein